MLKKSILFMLILLLPTLLFADKYSFTKFTWCKGIYFSSAAISITSLIAGLHYQKLSDDAFNNYENATDGEYATSYRVTSDSHNSSAAFWKNTSIYSGITALTFAGLDYFIFGRVNDNINVSLESTKPGIKLNIKF